MKRIRRLFKTSGLTPKKGALLLVLLAALLWTSRGAYDMYVRYSQSKDEYERVSKEMANLNVRETELQENIRTLHTSRGVEQELRTRFNAAKEGEELIMIVDSKNSSMTPDSSVVSLTWWQKFKNWFK